MKFLKSLQKKDLEDRMAELQPSEAESYESATYPSNVSAGIFAEGDLRIGAPVEVIEKASEAAPDSLRSTVVDLGASNGWRPKQDAPVSIIREITVDTAAANPRLVAITQPNEPYCEEYRSLRTHLIHEREKREIRSVVLVSAGPSEGKSVTAINLSWLLAQTDGIRTLIIDGDMRRPSVGEYLGLDTGAGFSDVLAERAVLSDCIIDLKPAGLHFLPAGRARDDVTELLSGPRFKDLLQEIYGKYDVVLIDAPPLHLFTDATILTNAADSALVVVCADRTPFRAAARLAESFARDKFLGVVLNQSDDVSIDEKYYQYPLYRNSR